MKAGYTAESGHWYDHKGEPRYKVPYADPKKGMRDTTLRDARKHGYVPSVTAILNVPAKPALEKWKRDQLLLAAMTLPQIDGETVDEYALRIQQDSYEHSRQARDRGTAIHASLEKAYTGEDYDPDHAKIVHAVSDGLMMKYDVQPWVAEASFSNDLGYGGKVDLYCQRIVLDFKTKEFDEDHLPKAYPEQAMQLAAYRYGLAELVYPTAILVNVFVSTTNPGLVHIVEHEEDNSFEKFQLLLKYWQLDKGYDSSFEVE